MSTIGERIKQLRKQYGYTQKEFGELLGVSDAHVSKIESSKDKASHALLSIINHKFNVNLEWLLDGYGDIFSKPTALGTNFDILLRRAEQQGISKEKLFKDTGITDEDYFSLKNGNNVINLLTLISISIYFGVSLDWLILGRFDNQAVIFEEDIFFHDMEKHFRNLTDENKELLATLAKNLDK